MDTNNIQPLLDEQLKLIKEFKDLKAALMQQVHQIRGFHEDAKRIVNESRKVLHTKAVMLVDIDSTYTKRRLRRLTSSITDSNSLYKEQKT